MIDHGKVDISMLAFTGAPSRPGLRLLILHDDPDREFDYVAGAERALEQAGEQGWTVVGRGGGRWRRPR